jgi:hypothetical protein
MRDERFWLKPVNELEVIAHPNMEKKELFAETQKCWDQFYSIREAIKRTRIGKRATWTLGGKMTYILFCIAFRRIYSGQGMAADGVKKNKLGFVTRVFMRMAVGTYNLFFRGKRGGVGVPMGGSKPISEVVPVVPAPSPHVLR